MYMVHVLGDDVFLVRAHLPTKDEGDVIAGREVCRCGETKLLYTPMKGHIHLLDRFFVYGEGRCVLAGHLHLYDGFDGEFGADHLSFFFGQLSFRDGITSSSEVRTNFNGIWWR